MSGAAPYPPWRAGVSTSEEGWPPANAQSLVQVNSIHGQGIDRLAERLHVEALAPDRLVEAVSVIDAQAFALGVQFHPEWQVCSHPDYLAIFQSFGAACRQRAAQR